MKDLFFRKALLGDKSWVWYLVTTIVVILAHVIGQLPIMAILMMKASEEGMNQDLLNEFSQTADFSLIGVSSNLGLILVVLGFIASLIALYLMVKYAHKRAFKTVVTAFDRVRWGRIWFAFGIWMLFTAAIEIGYYFTHPENYEFSLNLAKYLPLLLITLVFIPFQTSFEEIMIRGYALQGMGLWAKYRIVPIILSSMIFGLLHGFNPEIGEFGFGVMMTYYISVGIFLAIITVMDDGLELALGIHAATNIYGAAIVTFSGSALQTDAPIRALEINAPLMLAFFLLSATIFMLWAQRKYGWSSFARIFGKIDLEVGLIAEVEPKEI